MFKKKNIDKSKAQSNKKLNPGSNAKNGLEKKLDKKTPKGSENSSKDKKFFNIKKLKIFSRFKNKDVTTGNKQNNSINGSKSNSNTNSTLIEEESVPYILHRDSSIFQESPTNKSSTNSEKSKSAILKITKPRSGGLKGEKPKNGGLKNAKLKSEGLKSGDLKSDKSKSGDLKSDKSKSGDLKSEGLKSEKSKNEELKNEKSKSGDLKSEALKNEKSKSDGIKSGSLKNDGLKNEKSESIISKASLSLNSDKVASSGNEKIETQPKDENGIILNSLDSKNSKINSKELNKNDKKNSTIKEKLTLKKIFKSPFNNTSKNSTEYNDINEITDLKEKFKHAKSIFDKKIASKKSINSSSSKSTEDHSENGILKKIEIFNFLNKKKNEKNKNFFMKKKAGLNKNDPKSIIKKKSSNNTNLLNREPSTNSIQHSTSTTMISGIKEKKNSLIERANKIENNQVKISRDLNNTNDDLYVGNRHTNHIVNKQILFNVDPPLLFIENSFALCPVTPISDVIEMIYSICEKNKDESIKKLNDCKENNQKISSTLMLSLGALEGEDESVISNLNKRGELQKQNLKEAYDIVESISWD